MLPRQSLFSILNVTSSIYITLSPLKEISFIGVDTVGILGNPLVVVAVVRKVACIVRAEVADRIRHMVVERMVAEAGIQYTDLVRRIHREQRLREAHNIQVVA